MRGEARAFLGAHEGQVADPVIEAAPATIPAIPVSSTLLCSAPDAATPTTRLATEMIPSLAPRTAARSQPMRPDLWDSLCMRAMVALHSTLRSAGVKPRDTGAGSA